MAKGTKEESEALVYEKALLDWMMRRFLILGILGCGFLLYHVLGSIPATVWEQNLFSALPQVLTGILLSLAGGAWFGCIPAGLIGTWYSLRRSNSFIGGNLTALVLLFSGIFLFACAFSPMFLLSQYRKVKVLERSTGKKG